MVPIEIHKNFSLLAREKMFSEAEVKLSNIVDSIYCKSQAG